MHNMSNISVFGKTWGVFDEKQGKAQEEINTANHGAIKSNLYETGIPITWQQGSIKSDTGAATPSDTRLRTIGYFSASWSSGVTIDIPDGFKLCLYGYTDGNISSYIGQISDGWVTGTLSLSFLPYNCNFIRAVLAYSDNSDITPEDAPTVVIKEYVESGLQKRYIAPAFRTGKIKDDGTASPDTTRIRTTRYLKFGNKVNVFVPSGYKIKVFKYTDCVSTALIEYSDFITSTFMLDTDTSLYYRFMIGASDDSTISASAADGFKFEDFNRSQICIESTNDDTDRTNEINAYLDTYNRVKLGVGKFYTTGITMPDDSTIEGSGYNTILFLTGTSAANAITLGSRCAVRNMQIAGRETDYVLESDDPEAEIVPSTPEDRHGIYFGGDVGKGIVENCYIHGFSGGAITAYNTGYSSQNGLHIKSCDLLLNSVGVYLKYLTEFHLVENCNIVTNYYGIINNGGNNTIVGCNISSTYYAFYFNNSEGTYNNNMHGLMANCEMKHIRIKSIYINNTISSFLFTGCQFGSGGIELINANYMNFGNCVSSDEFSIDVTGGGTTIFNGFIMRSTSNVNITNNDKVKFVNCFDSSGRPFRTPYAIEPIATNAYPTDTATGAIASFPDGAENVPVKDLTINIEPAQDLHGYDNPWPAGGGKNKLVPQVVNYQNQGVTITQDGYNAKIVVNNASGYPFTRFGIIPASFPPGTYYLTTDKTITGVAVRVYDRTVTPAQSIDNGNRVFTISEDHNELSVEVAITSTTIVNGTYFIAVCISDENAFSPYSNICPITGWTGCNGGVAKTNLIPFPYVNSTTPYGTINDDGTIDIDTSTSGGAKYIWLYGSANSPIPEWIKPNTTYTVSGQITSTKLQVIFYGTNAAVFQTTAAQVPLTFTTPTDFSQYTGFAIAIQLMNNYSQSGKAKPMLQLGSSASEFEPYQGNTFSVEFPSSAGTVYGGTLDVTTGLLTVDRKIVEIQTLDWYYDSSNALFTVDISDMKSGYSYSSTITKTICSCYKYKGNVRGWSSMYSGEFGIANKNFRIKDTRYNTASAFKSALSGETILYELDTPVTYQLTPIEVKTLLGYNNIWADTGDSTVEYRANTKLYIEKLTAPTEDDMVANNAIAANKYFMVGNKLYYSTTSIAAGAALTVGTNCQESNLAAALNALNS